MSNLEGGKKLFFFIDNTKKQLVQKFGRAVTSEYFTNSLLYLRTCGFWIKQEIKHLFLFSQFIDLL